MGYTLSQLQDLSRQAGWPENLIAKAAAIWMYESNGNVYAHNTNGENSYGLAQVYLKYHPTFDVSRYTDPIYNLVFAYDIFGHQGWNAWRTSLGKYNRDFQGIASQSNAIYQGGGGGDINPVDTVNALLASNENGDATTIVIAAAVLLAIILIRN